MPNLTYTGNLPVPPNDPSQDVNAMQVNCNSVLNILSSPTNPTLDNIGFNDANGGFHNQVSMPAQAAPGLQGMDGVVFCGTNTGNNWPYWENALGDFQLCGSASANNPSVNGATNPISPYSNGWTFLPGGFILQWGIILIGTGLAGSTIPIYGPLVSTSVLFVATEHTNTTNNINFPNQCFNVQATLIPAPGPLPAPPTTAGTISITSLSTTGFTFRGIGGNYNGFYWTALGR